MFHEVAAVQYLSNVHFKKNYNFFLSGQLAEVLQINVVRTFF